MGFTNFPNGVTSFGCLVPDGGRFSSPWATHYFVDGTNGSDSNDGKTPAKALKTIQAAVNKAVGQDVIYVRSQPYLIGSGYTRYEEDVTVTLGGSGGASGVACTNANMSIIGVCSNTSNADYSGVRWKHATATNLTVDAPGLHLENIGFFSEGATYGIYLRNNGGTDTQRGSDGFSMYHCAMKGKGIYVVDGGDGFSVDSSRFQCAYDGTVACISVTCNSQSARRFTIRNCEWLDGNGTPPKAACIVVNGAMTELLIRDCFFPQSPTDGVVINLTGSVEGLGANLYFAEADISTDAIVESNVLFAGIYDVSGINSAY